MCVLKLPNMCEEIVEKRSLFTKGKGSQRLKPGFIWDQGI